MTGKTLNLREHLTLVSIEDRAAVLDVEKRCYYDLNETAFFLLKLMEAGCLHENIKAALLSEFDVADETAQVDVEHFVGELLSLGLVDISDATSHEIVRELHGERKPYRTPQFENAAEIAVAAGRLDATRSPDL